MNEAFSGDDPEEIARMSFPEYRKSSWTNTRPS